MATYIDVTASPYNADPTGATDCTTAVGNALTAAIAAKIAVYFPPGTYQISGAPCLSIPVNTAGLRLFGQNATIQWDSCASGSHAIFVHAGCSRIELEGLAFKCHTTSSGIDDYSVNLGAALYVEAGSSDFLIDRCHFDHVEPAFFAADDSVQNTSSQLIYSRCVSVNQPNALSPPSYSKIIDSDFHDTSVVNTRSHSIYVFGTAEHVTITGNSFKNQGDATIEIRANQAKRLQKRDWLIANNRFEGGTSYAMFLSTQASEINLGTMVIAGNVFKNAGGIIGIGLNDAVFEGNVMEWDYQAATTGYTGIAVTSEFETTDNTQCVSHGCIVANNRFVNRHPYFGVVHVTATSGVPNIADGDMITVDGVMYTWRTSPSAAKDIQIGSDVDACVKNLAHMLQGRATWPCLPLLRELTDVWYSVFDNEGTLWIASYRTFALASSTSGVTITAVVDHSGLLASSVNVSAAIAPVIRGNSMDWATIILVDTVDALVEGNVITPGAGGVGIRSLHNAFPVFAGNRLLFDRSQPVAEMLADEVVISYDAFPVIRDMDILLNQGGGSAIYMLPWLQGAQGYVPVGDGKARAYLYFGHEIEAAADPGARAFHWEEGDQILLYNSATAVTYTFTFKRSSPNGTTEFNSYATLTTLINSHTVGSWTASNPVATFAGSDMIGDGYLELAAGSAGAARNADAINLVQTTRGPRTCGVYLRPWADGGIYLGGGWQQFAGGSVVAAGPPPQKPTKTAVFTPLASTNSPMFVQGVDAASDALAPRCYQADTIPGVCYVITHAGAVGTEKFFWKVG